MKNTTRIMGAPYGMGGERGEDTDNYRQTAEDDSMNFDKIIAAAYACVRYCNQKLETPFLLPWVKYEEFLNDAFGRDTVGSWSDDEYDIHRDVMCEFADGIFRGKMHFTPPNSKYPGAAKLQTRYILDSQSSSGE